MHRTRWLPLGFSLVALLVVVPPAGAQDSALTDLRAALLALRPDPYGARGSHGETPAFAAIKQQLRGWVEDRLGAFVRDGDELIMARELSAELFNGDLLCEASDGTLHDRCDRGASVDYSPRGFLGEIRLQRLQNGKILVVRTAVGVICGYDESAYVYAWRNDRWQLLLAAEQDTSGRQPFKPLHLDAVLVSGAPGDDDGDRLVLTLGHPPRCASNWHPVTYRLWRVGPTRSVVTLLLDRVEPAFLDGEPPILGSVGANDALIEFRTGSLDLDVHNRTAVRHYRIDGGAVRRVDPIALGPGNFVEEWLREPWEEAVAWTDAAARTALDPWHDQLRADYRSGEFLGPTRRCARAADLWQVGLRFGNPDKPTDVYFLVRWQPPYRFRLVDVANRAWRDCAADDPDADERRTLFPVQDWR
ncbi:MAG: hypothetical protein HY060_10905 [Proteobacteria bacterium]|nr:hypothetical protein [Pseudomonadota bacterium]